MTTIKQISNLAGVSRGTVDRVLHNRGGVNKETERKVREIAAMVNYIPNKAGKTLAVRKKNLKLGMMLLNSTSSNPFINDVVLGARQKSRELSDYGVSVEFRQTAIGHPQQQLSCIDDLVKTGIGGLAIMPENDPDIAAKLLALNEQGIKVVTVNTDIDGTGRLAYVGSNYYKAGETAAGLMAMITGGCARIGIVSGAENVLCHTARIEGFNSRVQACYPALKTTKVIYNHDDDFESFEKTKALLEENPEIDALYITAGGVFGACRAVTDLGRSGGIKIVCFDTVPTTQTMIRNRTILAAIDQQPLKQGAKALELLFEHLAMDAPLVNEFIYTENVIKILENL